MAKTNNEMIIEVLTKHSCLTANEIRNFVIRDYGEILSVATISGVLRGLISKGKAASSSNGYNKNVYWLVKPAWEGVKDDESF